MIEILHINKTVDSMSDALNKFQDRLSDKKYKLLFSLLLTNRGKTPYEVFTFIYMKDNKRRGSLKLYSSPFKINNIKTRKICLIS